MSPRTDDSIRPRATGLAVWSAVFACGLLSAPPTVRGEQPVGPGKVVLVRGMMTVFSLGLDGIAKQLSEQGLDVQVVPASLATTAVDRIAQQYADGRIEGPLVLIGHSLGADLLPGMARRCACNGLCVDLMIMIDSTHPSNVPANVKRCANLYQSEVSPHWLPIFRGGKVHADSDATELVNIDVHRLAEDGQDGGINHFTIEKSPWIQQLIVEEVLLTAGRSACCAAAN